MDLENTIRKVSLSLAGLSLVASISCSSNQQEKTGSHQSAVPAVEQTASAYEQARVESPVNEKQSADVSKIRFKKLHYHRQYTTQDLYRFYLEEKPATKHIGFDEYKRRFDRRNKVLESASVDFLYLEDSNRDGSVGDYL